MTNQTIVEMIFSQIMFWGITVFAALIWLEFYNSEGGRMRVLILELFASKTFAYGLAGTYYLFWDFGYFQNTSALWLRLVINAPMIIVMIRLYRFIKYRK